MKENDNQSPYWNSNSMKVIINEENFHGDDENKNYSSTNTSLNSSSSSSGGSGSNNNIINNNSNNNSNNNINNNINFSIEDEIEKSLEQNNGNEIIIIKKKQEFWRSRINLGLCPIIFLEGLFLFCYIPFVFYYTKNIYNNFDNNRIGNLLVLVFFHLIFIITQICFYRASFTDPGGIPDNFPDFLLQSQDLESVSFYEFNSSGKNRKCSKCSLNKPDRCHHCSKCKRCILKMDHHCPFINNCVGFYNYKFFVLFLMWSTTLCLFVLCTTSANLKNLLQQGSDSVVLGIVSIIALVFGLGLFFFTMTHMKYILYNETTIEHFEKNNKSSGNNSNNRNLGRDDKGNDGSRANIFNIGFKKNFCQVFGKNPLTWFLPIAINYTILSGLEFPVQHERSPLISTSSS
ncbi:hypothetical protein ACTFIY_005209 [Dictyostelium cf. discoideum]